MKKKSPTGIRGNIRIPMAAQAHNGVGVTFQNPQIARLCACAFGALGFISANTKVMLQSRGCWDDVVQAIYCAVIEYWRVYKHRQKDFDNDYKDFMNHINRAVYTAIRELIPEHKRTRFEISVPNRIFNRVRNLLEVDGIPVCLERDICRDIEEGIYAGATNFTF